MCIFEIFGLGGQVRFQVKNLSEIIKTAEIMCIFEMFGLWVAG